MDKTTTLKKVAEKSGFAISTVSAVLRGQGDLYHIAPATQQEIRKTAERLNYRRNMMATYLRAGRSNFVALLDTSFNTPIRQYRQRLIAQRLKSAGFQILMYDFHWMEEEQKKLLHELEGIPLSGLIMDATDAAPALEYAKKFIKKHPLILIDTGQARNMDQVILNRQKVSYLMARHLLNAGYRNICYTLAPHASNWLLVERKKGFEMALKEAGISPGEDNYLWNELSNIDSYRRGYLLGQMILSSGKPLPDAVMGLNDQIAIGIMKAFRERDISVPDDVAVVGAENLPESEYAQVPLTTVDFQIDKIAEETVDLFMKRQNGDWKDFPRRITIIPSLVIRESCGNK